MRDRVASPAMSENEIDILGDLVGGDADSGSEHGSQCNQQTGAAFDANEFLDMGYQYEGGDGDEDEAFIALQQAASFRKNTNIKGKSVKKGGGFQAMGLSSNLLRAITRKGFSVPTPIQRKTIPLILDKKDVVGMARTGSGKTAAFVIPMVERLRAHSARVGSRALIMSPSRELALQTLKVVKEFSRGTDLKCVLLVGGDSLEEQFSMMATNPDIIIATPGRFLHLKVEMSLDLSSIQYVVFDEADRLFEMGFAAQLTEILHALPVYRQTLLFSATLPKSLVEFARAGLQEPSLVRLDAETKISPDLQSAFFSVKGGEKEGALLHILHDIIKMPTGLPAGVDPKKDDEKRPKKRKRGADGAGKPTEHSTIVFAATKHHVEYLAALLRDSGFAVSYVYGSLDQTARKDQVDRFRGGRSNILVVTDVAARGIDIPVLANVINYDFPPQPKIFIHRVGRTARAGQRGWSYSLVQASDAPYLLDLQLFLGRKLIMGQEHDEMSTFADDIVVGALRRDQVEQYVELVQERLKSDIDTGALRVVVGKAEKLYKRTRNSASAESAKRAREVVASKPWMQLHLMFGKDAGNMEEERANMLARISGYRPQETIFEIGTKGRPGVNEAADIMRNIREKITPRRPAEEAAVAAAAAATTADGMSAADDEVDWDTEDDNNKVPNPESDEDDRHGIDGKSDSEFEVTVSNSTGKKATTFEDSEVFLSYTPRTMNTAEEKGYGVHSGGNFVEAARDVTMDLTQDEAKSFGLPTRSKLRWDQKGRKYVSRANDEDGSRGAKMIRGESGVKIAASFQSGRFERWKRDRRLGKMPRVGEEEKSNVARLAASESNNVAPNGFRYKHKQEKAPKEADKYRDDYHVRKKRVSEAKEKRIGKFKDGPGSKKEIKSQEDIRKARVIKERKREKNARPSKKPRNK